MADRDGRKSWMYPPNGTSRNSTIVNKYVFSIVPNFLKSHFVVPLALLSCVVGRSAAAPPVESGAEDWEGDTAFYRAFDGTVGKSIRVKLFLSRLGRDLDGYYYNAADRMPIAIHGEIKSDGSLYLTEFPFGASDQSDTTFGKFRGTLSEDGSQISGTWVPTQGERELEFSFREDYRGVLRASLCQMFSHWENRRGDKVISRERSAYFVQFHGDAPGIRRINAAIRAMVESAFAGAHSGGSINLESAGDVVTSATAPTLSVLHRGIEVRPPELGVGAFDRSDIESFTFAILPVMNEAGLICLRCYWDEYTGGAHPNYWDKYITFNVVSGTRLRPGDVFEAGHEAPVAELGAKELRRSWGLRPGAPLSEGSTFQAGLTLNENWFVHPGGIGYSYNPYEIGPYSAGFIRFALPWSEVRPWIRPGSPVLRATMTAVPALTGVSGQR